MSGAGKPVRCRSMLAAMALLVLLTGCGAASGGISTDETMSTPESVEAEAKSPAVPSDGEAEDTVSITVTVESVVYTATLGNSETVRALTEQIPLTLDMRELNGNEKYFYLDGSLPTDASRLGQIHAADLMLYVDNCLVLFYENFSSSYTYTRLGSLDDPSGLAEAVGSDGVTVTFALAE